MFFKKKVKASEIANSLELMSFGGDLLEDKKNCKEFFGVEQLTENQLKELSMFNMFTHVKAFNDVFGGDQVSHVILDKLHDRIYENMFNLPPDPHSVMSFGLLKFEHVLQQRYAEYYKCFEAKDGTEITIKFGKTLGNHLFGETVEKFLLVGIYAMDKLISKTEIANSTKRNFKIIIN